jgi:hypothetical protein
MKKLLFILCIFSIYTSLIAQTASSSKVSLNNFNKYLIKIDSNVTYNVSTTSSFLKMVSAAYTIDYNNVTKYFEVLTKRKLEQNIIDGKLQKNATPMTEFIYVGLVEHSPSILSNTISTQ